jgi:hypothetical protein
MEIYQIIKDRPQSEIRSSRSWNTRNLL